MSDLSELSRSLESDDAEERRCAAAALRQVEAPGGVALLMRALGDSDWRVRKEAVLSAVALAPSGSVLAALMELLRPGDNIGARNSAVEALSGYGLHAISALAPVLGELDADGKKLVVDAVAAMGRPEALPLLRALLEDADVNVRAAAIEAVAAIGQGRAEDAISLLDACLDGSGTFERLAALTGLNRLAAEVPWERLEPLAADPILRPAVLAAAARSGAEAAVPLLLEALELAHARTFAELLESGLRLAHANPVARAALAEGLARRPAPVRERVLALAADDEAATEARRAALGVAAWFGDEAAARVAVMALSDDSLAEQAEVTLAQLGGAAVGALVGGAEAPAPEQRAACIELLGPLVAIDPEATAAAKRALADAAPEVVARALEALASAGDRNTLEDAVRLLGAGPLVRQSARRALVVLVRRFPEQVELLGGRAAVDSTLAEAAAVAIEALAAPGAQAEKYVPFLRSALDSPVSSTRCAAVSALATQSGAEAVDLVAFALGDEESEVRLAAVRALGQLTDGSGAPLGFERLIEVAKSSAEPELAAQAARALGELGDSRAVAVLGELSAREPLLAVTALEALSSFEGPERDQYLVAALAHADAEVVKSAMRALAASRRADTAGQLAACLEHPDWDVRRIAAELLGRIGGDVALAALRGRLAVEAHELTRAELARMLVEIETAGGRRRTAPPPSLRGGSR